MSRGRVIFWAHVVVGIYCVACGLSDRTGHFQRWMIPNIVVFYGLASSAFLFPVLAATWVKRAAPPHPVLLLFTHAAVSFAQLFWGLLPLIS